MRHGRFVGALRAFGDACKNRVLNLHERDL
jgi:hypothetical protein